MVNLNNSSRLPHISINMTPLPTLKLQTSYADVNALLRFLSCGAKIENKSFILDTYHTSARVNWFQFPFTTVSYSIIPFLVVFPLIKVTVCFVKNGSHLFKNLLLLVT